MEKLIFFANLKENLKLLNKIIPTFEWGKVVQRPCPYSYEKLKKSKNRKVLLQASNK